MDRLLSLSQAARMVGVRRKVLQQEIQDGKVEAFEGHIRMSELLKVYPDASQDKSGILEKVQRIQDAALMKGVGDVSQDPDRLAAELHRLKIQYGMVQDELAGYKQLAQETETQLLDFQSRCDRQQAKLLGTLIGWYMHQLKMQERD